MNTSLPYADFQQSAACLDYRRLGKQRVEAKQLLQALHFGSTWLAHPAAQMWKGYESLLGFYWSVMCQEWKSRGYSDYLLPEAERYCATAPSCGRPWWLGERQFHRAHQSNLLRKDPGHYGKFGWDVPPGLPYLWPLPGGGYRDAKLAAGRAPIRLRKGRG